MILHRNRPHEIDVSCDTIKILLQGKAIIVRARLIAHDPDSDCAYSHFIWSAPSAGDTRHSFCPTHIVMLGAAHWRLANALENANAKVVVILNFCTTANILNPRILGQIVDWLKKGKSSARLDIADCSGIERSHLDWSWRIIKQDHFINDFVFYYTAIRQSRSNWDDNIRRAENRGGALRQCCSLAAGGAVRVD